MENKEMLNSINDCFVEIFNKQPNQKELKFILSNLPQDIRAHGNQWGWYDTEVGDKICRWLRENVNNSNTK